MIAVFAITQRQYLGWCLNHRMVNGVECVRIKSRNDIDGYAFDGIVSLDYQANPDLVEAVLQNLTICE